jgi:hypothetical protein
MFPIHEQPHQPGLLRVGYVLGANAGHALVAYTTSQTWPAGRPLPLGARRFTTQAAAQLNQSRAFILRLDVLAKLPLTAAWFPDIAMADQGIIAVADERLQDELTDLANHILRRHRTSIEMRGP